MYQQMIDVRFVRCDSTLHSRMSAEYCRMKLDLVQVASSWLGKLSEPKDGVLAKINSLALVSVSAEYVG